MASTSPAPKRQHGNRGASVGARMQSQPLAALTSITRVAARACGTEFAALHFTERKLRWLSASPGLDEICTWEEIDSSLRTLAAGGEFFTQNAAADHRSRRVALVRGHCAIRSCAGAPLVSRDGQSLGALYVLDRKPGKLSSDGLDTLREVVRLGACLLDAWFAGGSHTLALEAAEQRYHDLFHHTTDLVFTQDLSGVVTAVNGSWERTLGFGRDEIVGRKISKLIDSQGERAIQQMIVEHTGGAAGRPRTVEFRSKDGQPVPLELTSRLLFQEGVPAGLMGLARTKEHRHGGPQGNRAAPRAADPLQHLHRLSTAFYAGSAELFADAVQACCGHLGTEVGVIGKIEGRVCRIHAATLHPDSPAVEKRLVIAGSRLSTCIEKKKTYLYSVGKPRLRRPIQDPGAAGFFLVTPIFRGDRLWGVLALGSRDRKPAVDSHGVRFVELVARSIGQRLPEEGQDARGPAIRRSAGQHKAPVIPFDTMERALREALESNEFSLRYQPQIAMDGSLAAIEVLLNWRSPKLGQVPVEQLIRTAEESGLIVPIGAWVLRRACHQNRRWRERGLRIVKLAVNVSALQFARPDFAGLVAETLEKTSLPPSLLELEVTESAVMKDVDQSIRVMDGLRELGVGISIDDFGTGYSSLSYLRRLPANALKIDRSFLDDRMPATTTLALIQTIASLAHELGLSVVGEGVETDDQLELLDRAGCDRVQGHLFGLPLTAASAGRLVRSAATGHPVPRFVKTPRRTAPPTRRN